MFMFVSLSFFFFKQKTEYEMRISDWSSDVCSSDLRGIQRRADAVGVDLPANRRAGGKALPGDRRAARPGPHRVIGPARAVARFIHAEIERSEERLGGKERVRTCRSGWSREREQKEETTRERGAKRKNYKYNK